MNERARAFFAEVRKAFQFLEQQYGYEQLEETIDYLGERRDMAAKCRYVGSHIGVEIWWYFAGAVISVTFVELQQVGVFPEKSSLEGIFFYYYPSVIS